MINHLIKHFGYTILGLSIIVGTVSIDNWSEAVKLSVQQSASALSCKADYDKAQKYQPVITQLTASIDASQLQPLPLRVHK